LQFTATADHERGLGDAGAVPTGGLLPAAEAPLGFRLPVRSMWVVRHRYRSIPSLCGMPLNASIVTLPSRAVKGIAGSKRHIWLVTSGTSSLTRPGARLQCRPGSQLSAAIKAARNDQRQQVLFAWHRT
jgi:hypothetical protein